MAGTTDHRNVAEAAHLLTIEDVLGLDECYQKLALQKVGCVVFTRGALPAITPARYAVSTPDIYFATGPHEDQHAGIAGTVVAFEVDSLDPDTGAGWTVVITGIAEPCGHPSSWLQVARLGLWPADGGHWRSVFRLPPGIVSGRRFTSSATTGQMRKRIREY